MAQINIDNYPSAFSQKIDFVKIDTQGAEYKILSGMKDVILHNRDIIKVVIEFWPNGLDMAGNSADQLIILLEKLFLMIL